MVYWSEMPSGTPLATSLELLLGTRSVAVWESARIPSHPRCLLSKCPLRTRRTDHRRRCPGTCLTDNGRSLSVPPSPKSCPRRTLCTSCPYLRGTCPQGNPSMMLTPLTHTGRLRISCNTVRCTPCCTNPRGKEHNPFHERNSCTGTSRVCMLEWARL